MTDDNGHTISASFPLVSIGANQSEAYVFVTPKPTINLTAGPKYVMLSLKTDPSYKVMAPSADTVYIVNQLMTGSLWQQNNFPASTMDWNSFASTDPGHTGVSMFYRYVFGLNPTNPSPSAGLPCYQIINDRLSVTFRRPLAVTDYTYIPEISDDLISWSALSNDIQQFVPSNANTNDLETVSYQSTTTVHGGKPKQYMRVLVQPQ